MVMSLLKLLKIYYFINGDVENSYKKWYME